MNIGSILQTLVFGITHPRLFLKKVKSFVFALSRYGVKNEKDESNQKYIIMMNLISMVSCGGLCTTGFMFVFMGEFFQASLHFAGALVWISPIYINRNGLKVASRLVVIIYSAIVLFLCSVWFTHYSTLDNYFLIVAITCLFLFSPKERKWLLLCVTLCLFLFVVESTPMQNYLPAFNTLTGERLAVANLVLLAGQIILILLDVLCFTYVSSIREASLLSKQKLLEETQYKVQLQNEDLKTFSIAASHNMQMPLYVSSFFINKMQTHPKVVEDAAIMEDVGLIKNGLEQIEQLVSGLFSYNRIINIENEKREISVQEEILSVKNNFLNNYPNAMIAVKGEDCKIVTNQLLFAIILQNLIDNGLRYNVSATPTINIELRKELHRLYIFVSDNGVGIPHKYLPVVLEPFKKIVSKVGLKSGNKLGLAGSKRAAERLGGGLSCVSSDDSGTTFCLEVPM